jgi:hypothetical protein
MLGDLGLARATGTLDDRVGGTPQYVAPEVAGHGKGSQQSDLFALGIMLYEFAQPGATAGGQVSPYAGRRASSNRHQRHLLADVSQWGPYQPLRDVRPDLPAAFDDVVRRTLAPDPHDRFINAMEVRHALESLLRKPPTTTPRRPVAAVDDLLSSAADAIGRLPAVDPDVHRATDLAFERLRRPPQIAVLSDGGAEASQFTLFLAGEPVAARAPAPYGTVISYIRDGAPERALVEGQSGSRVWVRMERDRHNVLRADLEVDAPRQLTLELDHPALRSLEFVDIPAAYSGHHQVSQALSQADLVIVLMRDASTAPARLQLLQQAARRSLAGPWGLIAVDTSTTGFGNQANGGDGSIEDLGFQQVLPLTNAGLTLRVFLQQMLDGAMADYVSASAALALCEMACDRSNDWSIAKRFIDRRDDLEAAFPELRDLRCLREDVRGDFTLPPAYARALRHTLSQPTAAGKLDLRSDQAGLDTIRGVAEERLLRWMTGLGDGTIPADSADAARVVVASLRRLQDAKEVG